VRVLICNQWFPPYSIGGVAQYNEFLTEGLSQRGHKVVVVSMLEKGSLEYEIRNGIHVYRVMMPGIPRLFSKMPLLGPHDRFLRNLLYSNSICRFLRKIVQEHKIDLIEYAEINGEGFYHRKYLGNLPYVIRCHTPYYLLEQTYEPGEMPFSCRFINWMEKKTIRKANGVTAPSRDLSARIEEWCDLPKNSAVPIPNLIDTDWFHPDPDYREDEILKILFVGRIERAKGIFVLADAIPEVLRKNKKVKFIFAGATRSLKGLQELKNYLSQLGCLQYCEVSGPVAKERLRELYQQCDVFVNPSTIYESFSYTNAEAMCCGKPVVTSNIGGMPQTVGDGVGGFVFKVGKSDDLAEKLSTLLDSQKLRSILGKGALYRASAFSIDSVSSHVAEYYRSLIQTQSMPQFEVLSNHSKLTRNP
jgi:glycosyltransferase involved in cell wall biosynthesis